MASIAGALARIKDDVGPFLSEASILAACREAGHRWRERELGPVATLHLFVLQVLNFNTAMTHLRHLAGRAVQAPAFCRARMRLPLGVLAALLRESASAGATTTPGAPPPAAAAGLWCGLRALLVDGSSTIAPDTPPNQEAFGQPAGCKPGCGFPVPKVLGLFDAFTGLVVELLTFPLYTHEQSKVWMLHPLLSRGDVLVGDRGFCSFWHLAMLRAREVMGVFRMHQLQIVDFRPHRKAAGQVGKKRRKGRPRSRFVRRLGKWDQVVEWARPKGRPAWMTPGQYRAMPGTLLVRELRYRIAANGQRTVCVTVATTLLDPAAYPKEKVAELYGIRWRVERHFAELKTTLRMRKVKSRTEAGVRKELLVYALVYNLVHAAMCRAASRQRVTPDRVSFVDALRWLVSAARPDDARPRPDLLINPHRPGRHEPRAVKDLQDSYTKMAHPRNELRAAMKKQAKPA